MILLEGYVAALLLFIGTATGFGLAFLIRPGRTVKVKIGADVEIEARSMREVDRLLALIDRPGK